ncbi:MAG: hypothetical protein NTZ42_04335 [Candidatus Gribaldobacteria bacterium]|nr:hypothetical protein [Candidatus Gribaldobacteria bacterium]
MINLLPSQDKNEFKKEIVFKKISAILSFHVICLLILIFALSLTSAFFVQQTEIIKEQAVQQEQQAQSAQFQTYKADAVSFNDTLRKLQSFWQGQILTSSFLEKFLPLVSSNVHLKSLSFKMSSKKIVMATAAVPQENINEGSNQIASSTDTSLQIIFGEARVEGVVDSRDGLYEFKKSLEGQKEFQEIVFAPSSWSRAKFPNFSLSFSFLPAKK